MHVHIHSYQKVASHGRQEHILYIFPQSLRLNSVSTDAPLVWSGNEAVSKVVRYMTK